MSSFSLEKRDDGIALIKVDVPKESVNTLKAEFIDEVTQLFSEMKKDDKVKGVVIYSGKTDSFIAGADIHMLNACKTAKEAEKLSLKGHEVFNLIENFDRPVVAAIHGACLGGGLELALACDYRIVSNSSKTQLALPEVQLGLLPGGGGTQRLPRMIGTANALDLMLTGKKVRPRKALKLGLADDLVAEVILIETAVDYAKGKLKVKKRKPQAFAMRLLEFTSFGRRFICQQASKKVMHTTKGNYPAPFKIIDCVRQGQGFWKKPAYALEARSFGELVATKESQALRSIFFATNDMKHDMDKLKSKPNPLHKIEVIGGGLMGGGIATVTALSAKLPVRIKDIRMEGLRDSLSYIYRILDKKKQRKFISQLEFDRTMALVTTATHYRGIKDVDLVVEAVFEDLKLKHTVLRDVEKYAHDDTVFATNTSSIPISDIASVAQRPQNVVGLHYFSPVEKMPLVEIIAHKKTSAKTIATTLDFARKQGKTAIVVQDGAGFYVNRILSLYMNEAAHLLLDGASVKEIDQTAEKFGFPVGPLKLLDEVGIDIGAKIVPILEEKLGDRFHLPPLFDDLLRDHRLGKKSKKGFYLYKKTKKAGKEVDLSVYRVLNLSHITTELPDNGMERCVLQMLNEAARCLEEKIIASPRDGDIGAIFGIGFPPFLGGPFRYMDQLGLKNVVKKLELLVDELGEQGKRFQPCSLLKKMAQDGKTFYNDSKK